MLKVIEDDQEAVTLGALEVYAVRETWGSCLVGYFTSKFPSRSTLLKLCESWNVRY